MAETMIHVPVNGCTLGFVLDEELVAKRRKALRDRLEVLKKDHRGITAKLDNESFREKAPWKVQHELLDRYADTLIEMVRSVKAHNAML